MPQAAFTLSVGVLGLGCLGRAEEWRITNAAPVQGSWSIAEVLFYADDECTEALPVAGGSSYAAPMDWPVARPAPRTAVQHKGDDCWGGGTGKKCKQAGYCLWCGRGNVCCRQGHADDPPICRSAVGFKTDYHHECVEVPAKSEEDILARHTEIYAFDSDPLTVFKASCPDLGSCPAGSLVVGVSIAEDDQTVRCIEIHEPAGTTASTRFQALRAVRPHFEAIACPGVCRSGKHVERGIPGICRDRVNQYGCGTGELFARGDSADCSACQSFSSVAWEEVTLPLVERIPTAGHNGELPFISTRLQMVPSGTDAKYQFSPVLHIGEDCWGECSTGYCSWCGKGNACCKKDRQQDPPECRNAVDFKTTLHECVAVAGPAPIIREEVKPWRAPSSTAMAFGSVFLFSLIPACIFRRRLSEYLGFSPRRKRKMSGWDEDEEHGKWY